MGYTRFVIGNVSDFERIGVLVLPEYRKSIDGTKVLIHHELLTDDEVDALIADFAQNGTEYWNLSIGNPVFEALMNSHEWKMDEV